MKRRDSSHRVSLAGPDGGRGAPTLTFDLSAPPPDVARAIELLEKLQESGDVPGHKLQSLKKVLQSEFCTAIREVGAGAGGGGASGCTCSKNRHC